MLDNLVAAAQLLVKLLLCPLMVTLLSRTTAGHDASHYFWHTKNPRRSTSCSPTRNFVVRLLELRGPQMILLGLLVLH